MVGLYIDDRLRYKQKGEGVGVSKKLKIKKLTYRLKYTIIGTSCLIPKNGAFTAKNEGKNRRKKQRRRAHE